MDRIKRNLIFYFVLGIAFYGIPWGIKDTGSGIVILLIIIPVICFLTSVMYGVTNGFNPWYALFAALIFTPSIFIFYNSTAWIYAIVYGVIAALGNLTALPFRKR